MVDIEELVATRAMCLLLMFLMMTILPMMLDYGVVDVLEISFCLLYVDRDTLAFCFGSILLFYIAALTSIFSALCPAFTKRGSSF